MIISIVAVLFTFGIVIFLHELGHYILCRLSGIRVDAFSFGFGPELYGRTSGPTRYSIRAIPLGGYVKPAGENIEDLSGAPDEYFAKPWYSRFLMALAGPSMNYLLAFVLFTGVIFVVGAPVPSKEPKLGDVSQGYPADAAGLKAGDRILSVDRAPVKEWEDIASAIHAKPEAEVKIEYERNGVAANITIRTMKGPEQRGLIGIAPAIDYRRVPGYEAIKMGAHQCWYWTSFTLKTLASNIYHREKPDLAGPIGIVNIVSKAAHTGLSDLIFLVGLISVAVGLFNLLPIPLLDGGHMLLYLWEGVSGRKLTPKILSAVNSVGIVFLVSILVFATYSDIMRIKNTHQAKKAAGAAVKP